jgi:hypothetical protein
MVLKGQPMIWWTKDFVQSERKHMSESSALLPPTRIPVADESSQVSQVGSIPEEPQILRMEKEEAEISLVSDTLTQDTEMSKPHSNQDDFRYGGWRAISSRIVESFWEISTRQTFLSKLVVVTSTGKFSWDDQLLSHLQDFQRIL